MQSIPLMHVKFYAGIECLRKLQFDACDNFMKIDLKTSFFLSFPVEDNERKEDMLREFLHVK